MKLVHTFWSDTNEVAGMTKGWVNAKYHLMSWALSCLQLKKLYNNVELVTDCNGYDILINKLKLPYTSIRLDLEECKPQFDPRLWVIKKLYSYTLHQEHFINVDGDVFIWDFFPKNFINSDLQAQNIDEQLWFYNKTLESIEELTFYIPDFVQKYRASGNPDRGSNAGVMGGKIPAFFAELYIQVQEFIDKNKSKLLLLKGETLDSLNFILEQYFFYCLSHEKNFKVNYLLGPISEPSFQDLVNFHKLPNQTNYIHLLGNWKRNGFVCEQLAMRLRIEYPEYYYRILELTKDIQDGIPLLSSKQIENNYIDIYYRNNPLFNEILTKSFTKKYISLPEDEIYFRTNKIIVSCCEKFKINIENENNMILKQKIDYLKLKIGECHIISLLDDIFNYENTKYNYCLTIPADNILLINDILSYENSNKIFSNQFSSASLCIRYNPIFTILESNFSWVLNRSLYGKTCDAIIEDNFDKESGPNHTLILLDKNNWELAEYSLDPIDTIFLYLLTPDTYQPLTSITAQIIDFFDGTAGNEREIEQLIEECVRFYAYAGVIQLSTTSNASQAVLNTSESS